MWRCTDTLVPPDWLLLAVQWKVLCPLWPLTYVVSCQDGTPLDGWCKKTQQRKVATPVENFLEGNPTELRDWRVNIGTTISHLLKRLWFKIVTLEKKKLGTYAKWCRWIFSLVIKVDWSVVETTERHAAARCCSLRIRFYNSAVSPKSLSLSNTSFRISVLRPSLLPEHSIPLPRAALKSHGRTPGRNPETGAPKQASSEYDAPVFHCCLLPLPYIN